MHRYITKEEYTFMDQSLIATVLDTYLDGVAIFSSVRNNNGEIVDFTYEYINNKGCELNERPKEETIGKTLLTLLPNHKETGIFAEYVHVVEANVPYITDSLIYEDTYGKGKTLKRAFEVKAFKVNDGFCVFWQDITFRKIHEHTLESKQMTTQVKYHALFEKMLSGFAYLKLITNSEGKAVDYLFIETNQAFERITELERKDIVGKKVTNVFPEIETAPNDWIARFEKVARQGKELRFEELLPQRNRYYRFSAYSPESGYVALIVDDITEKKDMEQRIQESAKKIENDRNILSTIINSVTAQIAYLDPEFNFIFVNQAYADITRYSIDTLIGKNHFELFPDETIQKLFIHTRDTGEVTEMTATPFQFKFQPERGTTYWDWKLTQLKIKQMHL